MHSFCTCIVINFEVSLCFLFNYKVTKNFSHMQVFLFLFSIFFANIQLLTLNPYIELTLV